MTITLRPMSPDEVAAYRSSAVDALAAQHASSGVSPDEARERAAAELARDLDGAVPGRRMAVLAVEAGGATAGAARLSDRDPWGGETGWVADLRLDESVDGLAGEVLPAIEDVLRAWGSTRVGVQVAGHDEQGRARYESGGYRLASQRMVKRLGRHASRGLPEGIAARPLDEEEFPDWLDLVRRGFAADLVRSGSLEAPEAEAKAAADVQRLLPAQQDTPGMAFRVLEHAERPVATVWVSERSPDGRPDRSWLYDIHVAEPFRGKGFGKAAMLVAENLALAAGHRAMALNVFGGNAPALSLYDALGYRVEIANLVKPL